MKRRPSTEPRWDVAIVGGGPAGLAAAVAVGRMNRRAIVFQAGDPRTSHAPCYHNYLGFPDGVSGKELLARGRAQAERWGAALVDAAVTSVEPREEGDASRFRLETTEGAYSAEGVVLATGVKDRQLRCGDLYAETGASVHYCVVCDAHEVRGERVAVVGDDATAYAMLWVLRDFTRELWLLLDGRPASLDQEHRARLARWGVHVVPADLASYACSPAGIAFMTGDDGETLRFPHVFIAQGTLPRTELAESVGCEVDEEGYFVTDAVQATTVPYVYAAGDCDGGHKQVTQAMAEGELAALELLRALRQDELAREDAAAGVITATAGAERPRRSR